MQWVALVLGALALGALTTSLVVGDQLASGFSTPTIRVDSASVAPGGSVTIALNALNVDRPGVGAATVDVVYDDSIIDATNCDADPGDSYDFALCNNDYAADTVRMTGISAFGVSGNPILADMTFQAVGQAGECSSLNVQVATFVDPDGLDIQVIDDDGQICILPATPAPTVATTGTPTATPTPTPTSTPTPSPTPSPDDDGDGLPNEVDPCPNDDDCDDDGLMDGSASSEDFNDNGVVDPGETDPTNWDSDGDGLSDGLERGLAVPEGQDTDVTNAHWQPDADPTSKTDPLNTDTNGDGVPDGEEDVNRNGRVDAGETDPSLITVSLTQGWKHTCYVGEAKPIDQALATVTDKVLAVYMLKEGQTFGRWFPEKPHVSTITTLNPYDQVFVLTSDAATWNQQFSGASQASVTLAPGWNSVCYSGATKDTETAIAGTGGQLSVIYALQADQTWLRYVPGRPNDSNLTHCPRLSSILVLLTDPAPTQWVFDP